MKVFLSADIEGTAGITHWDETDYDKGGRWYDYFREQMTREVAAACQGALAAGAADILVKDAHDSARNLIPSQLPKGVRVNRGWSGNPFSMVSGLNEGFDAVLLTGYHAPAWNNGNPLSHTMDTRVDEVVINDIRASEFLIHSWACALVGVPVVFVSGDAALCAHARDLIPAITAVAVSEGLGDSSTSLHPEAAVEEIRAGAEKALSSPLSSLSACLMQLPERFSAKVRYVTHVDAYAMSFYPGAQPVDEKTIAFTTANYQELLRFFHFVL